MKIENEPKMPPWRSFLKRVLPPGCQRAIIRIKTFFLFKAPFLPARIFRITFKPKTILFYPNIPHKENSVIAKICHIHAYRMITDPGKNFCLALNWQPTTYPVTDKGLSQLARENRVINAGCRDLSKRHIDSLFREIFGYSIMLDPLTHKGDCVVKSNENARHDGSVIKCPVGEIRKGVVYQKVINNQWEDGFVQDIRVPVFEGRIPFVYLKYRPVANRFSNENKKVVITALYDVLSEEEVKKIIRFCKRMNLDYGELDTARDKDNGKLYILDTNNTPWGPPNHISPKDYRTAVRLLAKTFENIFIKQRCGKNC